VPAAKAAATETGTAETATEAAAAKAATMEASAAKAAAASECLGRAARYQSHAKRGRGQKYSEAFHRINSFVNIIFRVSFPARSRLRMKRSRFNAVC
jgi:hypothetical protein